ncbi:MAG: hypothetical protein LUF35_06070 [Lachnospiraceae bacterium]|nr:hypothetical protein [Lachnospiraceae bacterium]
MGNCENNEETRAAEVPEKEQYIQSLVGELMADQEWEFPANQRFFLVADLDWTLLGL